MSCDIVSISVFNKDIKRLQKKYQNIKIDLNKLISQLKENPKTGTPIIGGCYKIRLPNSSVPTGKSGGFRVITYYVDSQNNVYLLTIYSKSELDNVPDSEIIELLQLVKQR